MCCLVDNGHFGARSDCVGCFTHSQQDGRVRRTIKELSSLGVDVVLSEDEASESANIAITTPLTDSVASSLVHPPPPMALRPGRQIALDLSVLIALVSDIVHAPLPENGPEGGSHMPRIELRYVELRKTPHA